MAARIAPLFNRVLIRRSKPAEKTVGGILLPESAQDKNNEGEVVAVGPGREERPVAVAVGDKVLLPEYGGSKIGVPGEDDLFLFHDDDILAVIKE
ncbi:uncharacterized protein AMSG_00454 [Thecamonas trahens ATCC 50062]|uniref:20 kDa chaperonin, chloroplastic n=1 Tax=Thecamonas trahens ATCC 50062 TaxID=461836 RepID=A0A0L0D8H8_THETB|nr:hypothetical protein AMSG_00454 [Thecamonas trahens ATCC 50062]KNC48677.1 hypothetical protein AMSG_00454 [Thecamonas trahens ATCC 50062]|eukprot:XP_013762733.1 hypothetical protein AMSG_00454 [Thecamonas trahens ATCC 50062]